MASEAEINTPIPKQEIFGKEYTGAKPKATLSLKVLDEEVWLSGSELKTDNSSSDEDKSVPEELKENRAKKGARRKTKCATRTTYMKSTKSQLTETKSNLTENCDVQQEVVSSSDGSLLGYEEEVEARKRETHLCLKRLGYWPKFYFSRNQADDEMSPMQKIMCLEEQIKEAERKYTVAKNTTDAMVDAMIDFLENLDDLSDPEWIYFIDITKKWIACFRNLDPSAKAIEYSSNLDLEKNVQKQEIILPKKRNIARNVSRRYGHLKNGKLKNLRTKKAHTSSNKKTSLDILMERIETESKESSYNDPYQLTTEEIQRIQHIDHQLESYRSCRSLIDTPDYLETSNEEKKDMSECANNTMADSSDIDEQIEKNDDHVSEKRNNFNFLTVRSSDHSENEVDESYGESDDEDYNSCEEDDLDC